MVDSKQVMYIAGVVGLIAVGAIGFSMYQKQKHPKVLKPWINRRLGDIVIEDDDSRRLRDIGLEDPDVHRLGAGLHPASACKRGECASMIGRSSFGY
jgi:hypothetical protein